MAVSYDRIARDIVFTLEKKSPDIFENIFLQNGVLAMLGLNGRVKITRGGNRFDERVHLGQNSTVAARSKYAQIPTDMQNNFLTAYYGQAVVSGSTVVNLVEVDQNQSESKIDDLAAKLLEETQRTFPNTISDLLMKATPTSTDPHSIPEIVQAAAYGSQTGSMGGIARADHTGATDATDAWQNQYSVNGGDLAAAAGIAQMSNFLWACSPGGTAMSEQPDVGLTTTGVYAQASGGADVLRRYGTSDQLIKLGFDNIKINRCAFLVDRSVTSGYAYCLNTNYIRLQVLGGPATKVVGDVKTLGDGKQTIPLQVRPAIESDDFLNYTIKVYIVLNFTVGGLRQHGVNTTLTEAAI